MHGVLSWMRKPIVSMAGGVVVPRQQIVANAMTRLESPTAEHSDSDDRRRRARRASSGASFTPMPVTALRNLRRSPASAPRFAMPAG